MRSLHKIFFSQSVPISFSKEVDAGRIANGIRIRVHDFYRESQDFGICFNRIQMLVVRN